jgi:hypothetical protein
LALGVGAADMANWLAFEEMCKLDADLLFFLVCFELADFVELRFDFALVLPLWRLLVLRVDLELLDDALLKLSASWPVVVDSRLSSSCNVLSDMLYSFVIY